MDAMVIDPYFGQNAVTVGVEEVFWKRLWRCYDSSVYCIYCQHSSGTLYKVHKDACTFTTGNVQVQQAATAYWLIMFACPALLTNRVGMLIVMALLLERIGQLVRT
ncbi:MAG: hypothetical protein ACLUJR_13805 [Mediterraneibacter gnavus]